MTTPSIMLKSASAHPGWTFWLLWFAATFAGGIAYALPVGIVQIVLGLEPLADPQRAVELDLATRVLGGVLCGAVSGATIGLAQWLVLRREIKRIGCWIAATAAGYASIGLLPLLANALQPGWLDWALTLIINGKMHWLARVVPAWPDASWVAGAVTLTLFGAVLGVTQWFALRERVNQAGWWVAISTGGWALAAALSAVPSDVLVVLATYDLPAAITGAGMVWVLRQPAPEIHPSR